MRKMLLALALMMAQASALAATPLPLYQGPPDITLRASKFQAIINKAVADHDAELALKHLKTQMPPKKI